MPIIKWSPFFFEPLDAMDKMMNEMAGTPPRALSSIVPPVDMYETDQAVVVETPLPGMDPNQIEISIDNGVLSIRGSSERTTEIDEKNYYRQEVRHGSVFRQIPLPARVAEAQAEASFEHGLLKVTVPKVGDQSSVKIQIKK